MKAAPSTLAALKQQRPEWEPWLRVVEATHADIGAPAWDAAVPAADAPGEARPLLADAALTLDRALLCGALARLVRATQSSGLGASATLARITDQVDPAALFAAMLGGDRGPLATIVGDEEAATVFPLLALVTLPFLHACRRQGSRLVGEWTQPYCPICAAWPAFVEMRGIERSRQARCGRCGAAWYAPLLKCQYCATDEHTRLVTLVPGDAQAMGAIEACTACGKYTKALTTLQGSPPASVYLDDLATVDLDIAALEAGYVRPQGLGYRLELRTKN